MGYSDMAESGSTWSAGGSSEPTDPDYAAQNELMIAKLEGNPEAQAAMQTAYDNRTDQSSSIIGGIVKAVVSPVGAYFNALGNFSTAMVEPFRNEEGEEEDNPLVDVYQGLNGDENTRWSENLASWGMDEDSKVTQGLGLAMDIFADPTTYVGAGKLGLAKRVVATGARDIAKRAARDVLEKEVAETGGIAVAKAGLTRIDAENVGKVVRAAGQEQVKGLGLHDDLLDAAGVLKGVQADELLLKSMDELTQGQASWIGNWAADAVMQRGGIKALLAKGPTVQDPWGKDWAIQPLLDVFTKTSRLNPKQLSEFATHVYGGVQKKGTAGMLGRTAAAAEGGVRLKFGVPFSKRLGDRFDSPWLGYRWQSKALPYSSRWNIMGKDYGASEMGNFFRGVSGIQKIDTLIAKSSRLDDGVWTDDDAKAFYAGGFAGLRSHATKTGKHLEFSREFGTKGTSSFIAASEKAGQFTGHFTKGSQMWRRMGVAGMDLQDEFRDAAQGKKLFREAASKHEREWAIAERQFNKDVLSKKIPDGGVVNKAAIAYLEGRSEDLSSVPLYMQKSLSQMKQGFPEILEMVRAEGAPVGDATEVLNRVRQDDIIKLSREKLGVLVNQRETLMSQMEAAVKAGSKDSGAAANALGDVNAKIEGLNSEISKVLTAQRGAEVELSMMEKYDEILHGLRGNVPGDKATPRNYFHRRMGQKAKDALEGVYVQAGSNYGDAKQLRATLERVLSGMGLEEATEYMKKAHPEALGALDAIFEESPYRVINGYINDMSEAVYRAKSVRAAKHAMGELGGFDNGLAMRTTVNLPTEYMDESAELAAAGGIAGRAKVKYKSAEEAMGQVAIALGADIEKTAHDAGMAAWGTRQAWRGTVTPTLPPGVKPWSVASATARKIQQQTGKAAEYMNRSDLEDLIDTEDYAKAVRELDEDPIGTAKKLDKLKEEGFDAPIQIDYDPRTGATMTTDGHHRLELAKRLFESGVDEAQYIPAFFKRFDPREVNNNALQGIKGAAPKRLGIEEVGSKFVSENRQLLDDTLGNTHHMGDIPGYTPEVFSPSQLFTKRAGRQGVVGNLTEAQAEGLEIAMREMNRVSAQSRGLVTPQTKAMWQEVNLDVDKTKWGILDAPELKGWVAHPFMAAEFNRMYKGMKGATGMHKWYREVVLGPWKKAATIFFPGFHARNFVGGAFNNMLGGVTVDNYKDSVKLLGVLKDGDKSRWFGETYQGSMVLDGKVRKNVTYGQLTKIMKNSAIVSGSALSLADTRLLLADEGYSGIRSGRRVLAEKAHLGKFGEYQSEMWGNVTYAEGMMRRLEQAGIGATTSIENFHRSAAFLQGLAQGGGDVAGARAFTMMRHGDYDELTDVEAVIRDVVPFYKWMRTNVPFQIKMMLENPAKQLVVGDVQNALIPDDTRKKYSDYLNQGMVIPIPGPLKKLIGAGEGPAALTMQLPLHDAVLSGSEFVSSMLPVIKNVAEVAIIKKNLYSGAPLEGENTTPTNGFMDAVGLSWALEKVGMVHKGPKGGYYTTDRVNHLAAVFPIYARAKDYINADPEREGIRSAAFVSAIIGVRPEELGQKALDDGEKDWYYNVIDPEIKRLSDAGYVLPTAYDLGMVTNQQSGYTPEAPTAGLGTGGLGN